MPSTLLAPHAQHRTQPPPRRGFFGFVVAGVTSLLALAGIGLFTYAAVHLARHASLPKPQVAPPTMADVDWQAPDSSVYCLACHWPVGRAVAGPEVERGHSQNVALNETQLQAIADMGTIAGPGDTLICMSCHTLEANGRPFMLADTLEDSRLCQRCHPGHYARNTPHDLRSSAPDECNRRGQTAVEGGPCSACHLAHRYAREIIPSPLDPDGWCITCHRAYGVAAGHARTQVMHHPESHCLQCHNSHDATHGEFLKAAAPDLCLECHKDYGSGVAGGMHPLARMTAPVPQNLLDAGADAGPDGHEVTCTTCHSVHEAAAEKLLVLAPQSNELCLSCHADALLKHGGAALSRHGQSPALNPAQQAVVAAWGTRTGPAGELLCVSCHKVHGGEPEAELLAFRPSYGETCTGCHPDQATVVGTPHDLTARFPTAQNRAGLTPAQAGTCSPCHMVHQFPRELVPGPGDPDGRCLACHLAGRIAEDRVTGGAEHPDTGCTDCHDPHAREHRRFLVLPEADLCASCHAAQMSLRGGPHDISASATSDHWHADARQQGGLCLSCHVPHGGERADLFRVTAGAAVGNHDEVCLACHADTAWNAPETGVIHPQQIAPDQHKVDLALVPHDDSGEPRMGCRTCHDPHGGAEPMHLARVRPGEPTEALCLHCHADKQYIKFTGHASARLSELGMDTDSCKPCHAMHAEREGSWGNMLSTRFLPRCETADGQPDCVPCLSCHHENGPAPFQRIATHPRRMLAAVGQEADPGHLPLFNAEGHPDPQGEVVCRTCHVSHGRLDLLKLMADNPTWSAQQQDAMRAQLRPFIEPNTCSICHGPRARLLFLRFHDPAVRTQTHVPVR